MAHLLGCRAPQHRHAPQYACRLTIAGDAQAVPLRTAV